MARTSILIQRRGARLGAARTREGVIKRAGGVTNEIIPESMTAAEFRRIALSFPEAIEGSHMGTIALEAAWRKRAPKKLAATYDAEDRGGNQLLP